MRPVNAYGLTDILDKALGQSYSSKYHNAQKIEMKMIPGHNTQNLEFLDKLRVMLEVSCHILDPRTFMKPSLGQDDLGPS